MKVSVTISQMFIMDNYLVFLLSNAIRYLNSNNILNDVHRLHDIADPLLKHDFNFSHPFLEMDDQIIIKKIM
jgi:hypothetical protein